MRSARPDAGRRDDDERELCAKLLSLVCATATVLGCIYAVYFAAVGLRSATPIGPACVAIAAAAIGLERRSGRSDLALDVALLLLFVLLAALTLLQDGIHSPALWLALPPVIAMIGCRWRIGGLLCALFAAQAALLHGHGAGSWSSVSLLTRDPPLQLTLAMTLAALSATLFVAFGSQLKRVQLLVADSARCAAESESAAKSRFLSVLSHEIRTPLQAVIGASEMLEQAPASPVAHGDLLAAQRQSAQVLMTLIGDVLDFSKLEAGKIELELAPLRLASLLAELRALFSTEAAAKGLRLSTTVSPDVPDVLLGDRARIRQILINLVANAIKFTADGGVDVHLGLDGRSTNADEASADRLLLRIAVSDSGVGIEPDAIESLFTPFQQADPSIARRFGGTGLGLSIAHELAAVMAGRIDVTSAPGRGSTFTLVLPLARAVPRESAPAAAPPRPVPRRGLVVLVVEDDPANRTIVAAMLEFLHAVAVIAETGEQALVLLETQAFDAVLLDVQLPVLDGPAVARRWRAREGVLKGGRLPIVAMTGNATEDTARECLASGMDAVLVKPFSLADLRARLFAAVG